MIDNLVNEIKKMLLIAKTYSDTDGELEELKKEEMQLSLNIEKSYNKMFDRVNKIIIKHGLALIPILIGTLVSSLSWLSSILLVIVIAHGVYDVYYESKEKGYNIRQLESKENGLKEQIINLENDTHEMEKNLIVACLELNEKIKLCEANGISLDDYNFSNDKVREIVKKILTFSDSYVNGDVDRTSSMRLIGHDFKFSSNIYNQGLHTDLISKKGIKRVKSK